MLEDVPTPPPASTPDTPAPLAWAFLVGRRTRTALQLALVAPDGAVTLARCEI